MAAARLSALPLAIVCTLALAPAVLRAQDIVCDPGDVEVRNLAFVGNTTFSDGALALLINTTRTNLAARNPALKWWAGRLFGRKRCLDRQDFPLDRLRLLLFYRNKGFDRASVDTSVAKLDNSAVAVTFRIQEGTPIRIDTLVIKGLEGVPEKSELIRGISLKPGQFFDKYAIDTAQAGLARALRSSGYPRAQVQRSFTAYSRERIATVALEAVPGPRARVGRIEVVVAPRDSLTKQQVSERTIRTIFGVDSGRVYSETELVTGQRRLYETEAFRAIRVDLDTASLKGGDSLQHIIVRVAEGDMRAATLGAGWGTLDCFRVQGGFSHYNFLGGGRRLDLSARLSKIGVGKPFVLNAGPIRSKYACTPDSRDERDTYGNLANYYLGATLRQPVLFGVRSLPAITVYREVRSEFNAFRRTTPIGAVGTLTSSRFPRMPLTTSYRVEAGRTEATAAFLCAVSLICEPADRQRAGRLQRLAVVSAGLVRNGTNNLLNPTGGTQVRFDVRHASPVVGSDDSLRFNTMVLDASWYRQIGNGVVASRVRAGSIFGTRLRTAFSDRSSFVPPQERLYAGGPNSVRGFKQNELGPNAYLSISAPVDVVIGVDTFVTIAANPGVRVVPVGGNSLIVGNLEYRAQSPFFSQILQFALFTDLGEVWNRGAADVNFGFIRMNVTPGVGARLLTAFGAIRLDLAYNGYQGRLGPAYFDQGFNATGGGGELFCVSPGNRLRVTGTGLDRRQESGACPGSHQPDVSPNLLRRLTPSISIGQAF